MPFDSLPEASPPAPGGLRRVLMTVLEAWYGRRERARQRRLLLAMDDRMLRDIGMSRCDAMQGVRRAVFRP